MLEAKLSEAAILKRLLDGESNTQWLELHALTPGLAIKELVADANFECNDEGIVRVGRDSDVSNTLIHA